MSDDTDTADGILPERVRSVTPLTGPRPNVEMDSIGWGIALGLAVLLVPLLPFILIVWGIAKLTELLTPT